MQSGSGTKSGLGVHRRVCVLGGLVVTGASLVALSTVLPSHADESSLERLEFKGGTPRTVAIYPGAGKEADNDDFRKAGRVFWYLTYTLKNTSAKPAKFFVSLSATSDKGVRYSDLPIPELEQKVEQLEQRKLLSKADLRAEKRPASSYESFAPEEVKECVALFNPLDPEADQVTIRIYGLVNDIEMKQLEGNEWEITERYLEVTYVRPGDEFFTSLDRFKPGVPKWVTETRKVKLPATGAE